MPRKPDLEFRNHMLSSLNATDIAAISPFLTEVTLNRDDVVHEIGDLVSDVYFPGSAVISVVTTMADGRSVESMTVGHEGAAGLVGAMSRLPVLSRAFTQIGGAAIRLDAQCLRSQAAASPALTELILRHVDLNVTQAEQSVACNVLHQVGPRMARWLLMTQDRTGGPILPLTQDYLAIMLGVQRTTVTKVALELKQAGLIGYMRGAIRILDRPALEATACECYAAGRARLTDVLQRARPEVCPAMA